MKILQSQQKQEERMVAERDLNNRLKHNNKHGSTTSEEQNIYSTILSAGRKIGLAAIIAALFVYLTGIIPSKVPVNNLPQLWSLSATDYMGATGLKPGWSWLGMYRYGDMLNYFGIAILGIVSIFCYLAIIPTLFKKKDFPFVLIAVAEVLVLVLAASGIINIGE